MWSTGADLGRVMACVAVAAGVLAAAPATAQGLGPDARNSLVFLGGDLSPTGYALWSGFERASRSLDRSGLRLRLVVGEGAYLARHPTLSDIFAIVDKSFGVLSIGAQHVAPTWRTAVFIGAAADVRVPDLRGMRDSDSGTRFGLELAAELWAEPTPTTRVALSGSLGSARGAWAARSLVGVLVGPVLVGPEFAAAGDPDGHQIRAGFALSGLLFGGFEGRMSGGYAVKEDGQDGGYLGLSVWRRL